jgi:hypothetical protein
MQPSANPSVESKYNVAMEYLKRCVQRPLDIATEFSLKKDCEGWLDALIVVHRGICPKTSDEEDKLIKKQYEDISKLMKTKINVVKQKGILLYKLHILDMKLRKLAQKKGMLLPSKDDPSNAIFEK